MSDRILKLRRLRVTLDVVLEADDCVTPDAPEEASWWDHLLFCASDEGQGAAVHVVRVMQITDLGSFELRESEIDARCKQLARDAEGEHLPALQERAEIDSLECRHIQEPPMRRGERTGE